MNGLMTIQSAHSVKDTIERIIALMESKGLTTFARIDHAANAKNAGLSLRPTELVIFGNPKAGTILMQDHQTCGIDLPLKALAWEDENGKVWLTHNETTWIAERHGLTVKSIETIVAMEGNLKTIFQKAVE